MKRDGISDYRGKFRVDVVRGKKSVFVGIFNTQEEAEKALQDAGQYARVPIGERSLAAQK